MNDKDSLMEIDFPHFYFRLFFSFIKSSFDGKKDLYFKGRRIYANDNSSKLQSILKVWKHGDSAAKLLIKRYNLKKKDVFEVTFDFF